MVPEQTLNNNKKEKKRKKFPETNESENTTYQPVRCSKSNTTMST